MSSVPANAVSSSPANSGPIAASRFASEAQADTRFDVLIVEADEATRLACEGLSSRMGILVKTAPSFIEAQGILASRPVDLLILDLDLSDQRGIQLLEGIRVSYPDLFVVIATAISTVSAAVQAMRLGASDFLTTPLAMDELVEVLERAAKRKAQLQKTREIHRQLTDGAERGTLVGHSPAMEKIHRIVSKVAFATHPVLILGESGTGRELLARTIHNHGRHADHPFVPVYCDELTPETMERVLFGYAKGAFPEATRARAGLLVEADNGTVFFKNIGELPLELQGRLVRVLQDREVRPVGAKDSVPVHARFLASADANLTELQQEGRFRRDLYFRLNVVNIQVPTLAERLEDIPLLTDHILRRIRQESGVPYELSTEVRQLLSDYSWPGNVRELESIIERACVMSSGPLLTVNDFPSQMQQTAVEESLSGHSFVVSNPSKVASIAELEKQAILSAIQQLHGDKLKAAKLLGIGKTTLYRKLKEYGIDPAHAN